MRTTLRDWLARFGSEDDPNVRARTLTRMTSLLLVGILPGYMALSWVFTRQPLWVYSTLLSTWAASALAHALVRSGRVRAASWLVVLTLWVTVAALVFGTGIHGPHLGAFAPLIVASGLLVSARVTLLVTGASCGLLLVIGELHRRGFYGPTAPLFPDLVAPLTQILATGVFVVVLTRSFSLAVRRLAAQREELAESQAQLRRAEKMDAFGQLAGGVAHDFNNILTSMLGHIDMLRMQAEDAGVDPEFHADLRELERSAERASKITRQLLAFSRKEVSDQGRARIGRVLEEADPMLRSLVRENVEFRVLSEISATVALAPASLEQVLMNLVINASDAMALGGALAVTTSREELDEPTATCTGDLAPGTYVVLTVSDSGTGIPAEQLDRVFEPFFTTKEVGRGTGLGLSTVLGIVQRAGGEIDVVSQSEAGTTFRVYLPEVRDDDGSPEGSKRSIPVPALRGGYVLVCEDDASILRLMKQALIGAGYDVLASSTPSEALEIGRRHAAELRLLVTDVIMPEMNGRELARALEEHVEGLQVLFVSGYTAGLLKDLGLELGDPRLLSKPFTPRELVARVRQTLEERAP